MGIVARQGIKFGMVNYLGFLLGSISTIFIYPADPAFLGSIRFIQPSAELIYPFIVFGLGTANIRFHQRFKAQNQQIDFLIFSFWIIIFNFLIVSGIIVLAGTFIPKIAQSEFWKMKSYIMLAVFFLSIVQLFARYISNFKRVAITGIFENFLPKLGSLIAFVLAIYLFWSKNFSLFVFVGFFGISALGLVLYFFRLNKDKKSGSLSVLKDVSFRKELFWFCLFALLGNMGNTLALRIDNVMIGEYLGNKQNGIYSILMSIVGFLTVPLAGIYAISGPIIVDSLENNKMHELEAFYQKVSKFLFIFGVILVGMMFCGMDYLFLLMKNGHRLLEAKNVVYILGTATLFDLATGFNSHLIAYSKYYRFNIYTMLLLAVLTISLNWTFINYTHLGIIGVAMATAVSLTIFNFIKLIFNYRKFKLQPFSIQYIYILFCGVLGLIVAWLLPVFDNNFINLLLKPISFLIIIFIGNIFFKFLPLKELKQFNFKSMKF